ncbi:hypothetical protein SDRG_08507 [Saprolegnia diclina VS20]|uniref:Glutaredoxin domain-containing protein n=1 Tax=Saprolegnia diclina (strain VS20) TaxID=1156394 RepID=T0Q7H3_SAPDV|nr:hypothetical protein SDRG_08507 [Saprolegnia diclina VS20]EQC33824.1 hypothetical protein SDRG_08507 [Saprolegnia diclina VS20]|eukprot:XP_008612619.1 hypothetical protein SDRG_08507 [Saprolegnia diclina VS20]
MMVVCNSASALRATSPDDWITKFTKDNGCALFGFAGCSYCTQAKAFFKSKGAHFGYCDIQDSSTTPTGQEIYRALESRTHQDTVPNIWLGGKFIGGLDALKKLESSGRLDAALAVAGCTNKPTAKPSTKPTVKPTRKPSTKPTTKPGTQPTVQHNGTLSDA